MSALKGGKEAKRTNRASRSGHVHIAEEATIIEVERRDDDPAERSLGGRTSSCSSCSGSASGDGTDDGPEAACDVRLLVATTAIKFGLLPVGGVYERRNIELRLREGTAPTAFKLLTFGFLPFLSVVPSEGFLTTAAPVLVTVRVETAFLVGRLCVELYLLLDGHEEIEPEQLPSFIVTAKVMARDRGKPTLRNGVHCVVHPEAASETTEPPGESDERSL